MSQSFRTSDESYSTLHSSEISPQMWPVILLKCL